MSDIATIRLERTSDEEVAMKVELAEWLDVISPKEAHKLLKVAPGRLRGCGDALLYPLARTGGRHLIQRYCGGGERAAVGPYRTFLRYLEADRSRVLTYPKV